MLGANLVASLCFASSVLAALWLLQTLVTLALGEDDGAVRRAGYLLVVVTVLMSATLRTSRTAARPAAPRQQCRCRTTIRGRRSQAGKPELRLLGLLFLRLFLRLGEVAARELACLDQIAEGGALLVLRVAVHLRDLLERVEHLLDVLLIFLGVE